MPEPVLRINIDQFLPGLIIDFGSVPKAIIRHHLVETLIDFCEHSQYWKEQIDSVFTVASINEYDIDIPAKTEIVEISSVSVNIDGDNVEIVNESSYQNRIRYSQHSPRTIYFDPIADILGKSVDITAALKPSRDAATVAKSIYADYYETILAGTKARLLAMPGKPWSEPNYSSQNAAIYVSGRDDAMRKAARAYSKSPQRYTPKKRSYF